MAYHGPELTDSIDQVIQSGHSLAASQFGSRNHDSHMGVNRTKPLPPPSSSAVSTRKDRSLSSRSNSTTLYDERRGGSAGGRAERDRQEILRESDEGSVSTRSGTLSGSGSQTSMADFFSSEVFQIVIHNPITAHRLLRFSQSRACGENMEFLQMVCSRHLGTTLSEPLEKLLTSPAGRQI